MKSSANNEKAPALVFQRQAGSAAGNDLFQLAPHFDHAELVAQVDVGNDHTGARQDPDRAFDRQALQRFAQRRTAQAQ
jgi:hypothetical protein